MKAFVPTHKIIQGDRVTLVQEIIGDEEYFTLQDFKDYYPDPCVVGSFGLDDIDPNIVIERNDYQDPELGEVVSWKRNTKLNIVRICVACHSENIIKHGKNKYLTQRYRCKDCETTFTGTTLTPSPP